MRPILIAGNWKMHGTVSSTKTLIQQILEESKKIEVELALFPPFVHIPQCNELLSRSNISFGAQNVSEYADGAYTGEISATMLKDLNCRYVIVGHSERRQLFQETNTQIANKCIRALNASIYPILCIGETLLQREKNLTLSVVKEQLEVIRILKDNCSAYHQIVIAYEPVWAIGTGQSASKEQAQFVHAAIREIVRNMDSADSDWANRIRILYGGSVKPDNAESLLSMPDIDGALVGGASLNAKQFIDIAKAAGKEG